MSDIVSEGWSGVRAVCDYCKHFQRGAPYFHCAAFEEIPDEILEGRNRHTTPLPGQENDIVFEPIEEE